MPEPQVLGHEDSIDSQDPNNEDTKTKTKSRRPANTAFRQQRLKAWQPILTPKTVLPLFFAIGIIFAPIGGLLIWASSQVQEITLDYTHCFTDAPEGDPADMPDSAVSMYFKANPDMPNPAKPQWSRQQVTAFYGNASNDAHVAAVDTTECTLTFPIVSTMKPPVLFYYRLTNFYQNHRRYAKSFNTDQLSGTAVSASTIHGSDCTPLTTITTADGVQKPYYPCGLAANSVFNDTFGSPILLNLPAGTTDSPNKTYVMKNDTGISWDSDKALYGPSKYNWADVAVPPNWQLRYPNNYSDDYHPDLVNDESFQVWMRLAGLPTFSKLAQRNDNEDMISGSYTVKINHQFNVVEYGGTKSIIITTRTIMGGKNPFLGIAYVVVGALCIVLGTLFTITHLIKPRKLGDHTYLSWNSETSNTATATGRDAAIAGGGDRNA